LKSQGDKARVRSELISNDQDNSVAQPPVPRWLFGVPLVVVVLAAVMFAGSHPGLLSLGLFILGVCVFAYLYVYIVAVWRRRQTKPKF
jgi:tellurite resistance protein TehA-like permease